MLGTKTEFTVHVKNGHDYRFLSDKRSEILNIIKFRFAEKMSENVPVYGIEKERTAEFTTLEKEYKRGFSRHPPKQFRLECENVIQSSRPSTVSTAGSEKDE